LTVKKIKDLESGRYITSTYFYDEKGREIQSLEEHPLWATIRHSSRYNFEDQVIETLTELSRPVPVKVSKYYSYNRAGLLSRISQRIDNGVLITIANYSYDELGKKSAVHFPSIADAAQEYRYNIRGWLQEMRGTSPGLFSQSLSYQESGKRWDGNIMGSQWSGLDGTVRKYDYSYDKPGRLLQADYKVASPSGENGRYSLDQISYDANGNIKSLRRRGALTEKKFGLVDDLEYQYESNISLGEYGNQLTRVVDSQSDIAYLSADFKPGQSPGPYRYDANGNQETNLDKGLSGMSYNLLNLPEEFTFTNGDRLEYAYSAAGTKLRQAVYRNGKLRRETHYAGDFVFVDGRLDHLLHEEGRMVFESGEAIYEFFLRDHLGNVRQVLRAPKTERVIATMEMANAKKEAAAFGQIGSSRQLGPEHNTTPGGTRVAWLNAGRGRLMGPSRRQDVCTGSRLQLSVQAKYEAPGKTNIRPDDFIKAGIREGLIADLQEIGLAGSVPTSLGILQIVDLVIKDLQQKAAPEAYMMYALYDRQGKLYESGKELLSKKAANGHEKLEKELYIGQEGYVEAFLVNETSENVWFDDFTVETTLSPVIQETHYDPWGLEMTGLGYQREGVKENRYLYNGKELLNDHNLNLYDFGARLYDPVLGRWMTVDPMADHPKQIEMSPYSAMWNNPIRYKDPDGRCPECEENVIDPTDGQSYTSTGGAEYTFGNGEWTRLGGTLDEHVVTHSRSEGSDFGGNNPSLGDIGTGLGLTGEGMWLLGENRSTSLYQQGFRRGLSGNYQLTGRNLSLFRNQPVTSATRPINRLAPIGKALSGGGTALSVVSLGFDVADYSSGDLSSFRLGYRATATSISIGVAYGLGGPYGAAAGGLFFMGEMAWNMTQPIRNEISRQYFQFKNDFENALRSGWRPR